MHVWLYVVIRLPRIRNFLLIESMTPILLRSLLVCLPTNVTKCLISSYFPFSCKCFYLFYFIVFFFIRFSYICILKHFLGHYFFKSKTLQDEFSPEGLCRAAMFALLVKEQLECWPEQSLRKRSWLTVPEAIECCRHPWMRQALEEGFLKWHDSGMTSTMNCVD